MPLPLPHGMPPPSPPGTPGQAGSPETPSTCACLLRRSARQGVASAQLLVCSSPDVEPDRLLPGRAALSASPSVPKLCGNLVCQADVSCLDRRNQNYTNILRFLTLGDKKLSPFNITHRFTHLFWLGDLNYRVEQPPTVRDSA